MINGFDDYTHELTAQEMQLVPILCNRLEKYHVGKENAVTNQRIQKGLSRPNLKVGPARVRKLINYVRSNHLVKRLIATSNGYYISNDYRELKQYVESLRQRENAIRNMRESMEKQTDALKYGEQRELL